MSELENFMGKTTKQPTITPGPITEIEAKQPETVAEAATSVGIAPSVLEKLLQALVDAQTKPGGIDPKVNAEIDRQAHAAPNIDMSDRVWIVLSDNKSIPRDGQFIGVNGATFMLRAGKKAFVPRALLQVLDAAVETIAIVDPDTLKIAEYRDVMRYPYQIVSAP
jgi:hypothetical protein